MIVCLGHCPKALPFIVEMIEGEIIGLEIIDKLVEISRLQKCSRKG